MKAFLPIIAQVRILNTKGEQMGTEHDGVPGNLSEVTLRL